MSERASQPLSPIGHRSRSEREALVRQWTPLAKSLANSYLPRLRLWYDFDDLVAEGQMAIWDASEHYDGSLGLASFKTYAYTVVQHRLHRLVLYWRAKRRRDASKTVSMDETYADGEPLRQFATEDLSAPDALVVRSERSAINDALDSMGFRDRKIIEARFVLGRTLKDVAKDHGITRERVRQIELAALKKLQRLLRPDFPGRARSGQVPLSYRSSTPVTVIARQRRENKRARAGSVLNWKNR